MIGKRLEVKFKKLKSFVVNFLNFPPDKHNPTSYIYSIYFIKIKKMIKYYNKTNLRENFTVP